MNLCPRFEDKILQLFFSLGMSPNGIFMACSSIVSGKMKVSLYRARQLSLALLVVAVVDHGHLRTDFSGSSPNSSGLLRLGRELLRRTSGDETTRAANASA